MQPNWSSVHKPATALWALLLTASRWLGRTVRAVGRRLWTAIGSLAQYTLTTTNTVTTNTRRLFAAFWDSRVRTILQQGLVGRRLDVSLLLCLLAPVLAIGTLWWVGSTMGYGALEAAVRGTWTGHAPALGVFLAVAALLTLAAISAALNSGLLPTTVLVAAPIFGAAVTRYGTTVTDSWGTAVVSLPEAVGVGLVVGVGFGAPIAVSGFVLGVGLRRVGSVLGADGKPLTPVEGN
jgi:hypothetical protein